MSMKNNTSNVPHDQLVQLYRKAIMSGMSLDTVEETIVRHVRRLDVTEAVETQETETTVSNLKKRLPKSVRVGAAILPVIFISFGLYLVGSAVGPILGYYVGMVPELQASQLQAPVPQEEVLEVTPVVITDFSDESNTDRVASKPRIIDLELDYTNLQNWFAGGELPELAQAQDAAVTEYIIDIPAVDIENAVVAVGGTDLNSSLIAYPGTALPGEWGSPVIFGHSVLRQFYNPSQKNPRRYTSIFSYIMTLKKGDEIYVTADGVKYTYVVQEKTEVKPEDVYILAQRYDSKQLKLVTCTPEGTYLRRGVITAQLVSEG